MGEWLQSLLPWGTEFLVRVQSYCSPAVYAFFTALTALGYEEFYLFLLPLVYWCVHKQAGIYLGYLAMISTYCSSWVKYVFKLPRPSDPRLYVPAPEESPSFLSGHAMSAVTNWGYLAALIRRRWAWAVAVLLILGIGVSRWVLGVHFPQDVIGGWLLGIVLLAVYVPLAPRVGRWIARRSTAVQIAVAAGVPVLLVFTFPAAVGGGYPNASAIKPMAALAGLGVGLVMERAWVGFAVAGEWWRRALRFLVGVVVVGLCYAGPKLVLPAELPYGAGLAVTFARYGLVGWSTAFFCPWLFVRLGLAGQERPAGRPRETPAVPGPTARGMAA